MDDFTNDLTTTARATIGGTVQGVIETAGDQDWFAVTLEAGQTYTVDLKGTVGAENSLYDTYLAGIFDRDSVLIPNTINDDSGYSANSYVAFTPTEDATYYIAASGYSTVTGAYDLTVQAANDDFTADVETTGVIGLDAPVTGNIELFNDVDWFAAELAANTIYNIRTDRDGGTYDLSTVVFDAAGVAVPNATQTLFYNDVTQLTQLMTLDAGTYYFAAQGGRDRGPYTVSLETVVDDLPADSTTTASVAVGAPARGRIDTLDDIDWVAVTLQAGTAYHFVGERADTAEGISGGADLKGLYDASGVLLADPFLDRFGAPNSSVSVEEDGTYYVAVGSHGYNVGEYDLVVNEVEFLRGTQNADWLNVTGTDLTAVYGIEGGAGVDMISFLSLDSRVVVNLTTDNVFQSGRVQAMQSIENVTGTGFDDVFRGSDRSEIMRGMAGNDTFYGSDNADTYDGGAGRDMLNYEAATDDISVSLLRGRGWEGDAGGDRIRNVENVTASNHDDFVWGDHSNNIIHGLGGNDTIMGNGGNDYILAGLGEDVIMYSGNMADYTVVHEGIRTQVTDNVGNDGVDVIGHGEILRFADGDMVLG